MPTYGDFEEPLYIKIEIYFEVRTKVMSFILSSNDGETTPKTADINSYTLDRESGSTT